MNPPYQSVDNLTSLLFPPLPKSKIYAAGILWFQRIEKVRKKRNHNVPSRTIRWELIKSQ
ncbi:MAG: hypothetical protein AMJ91_03030 [candidate division Zixibacteria bacterium SM23_73_3]|nr:MAG: hypothetical protein AMJ91_03030 [candidate division Zixibacteria bacterium SM23_73_3]